MLRYSTPVFQLVEGFCSLLVIQAAGQVTRYLVNGERGDGWMIGLLVVSASFLSTSFYFLWRITTFPGMDSQDAILIGIAITCAFFLCAWGIGSGRGNVVESSLLFAYITLCIYQIFTDYQPSSGSSSAPQPSSDDFPPLPPVLMASTLAKRMTTDCTGRWIEVAVLSRRDGLLWSPKNTSNPTSHRHGLTKIGGTSRHCSNDHKNAQKHCGEEEASA